jgi:hypothetical protein
VTTFAQVLEGQIQSDDAAHAALPAPAAEPTYLVFRSFCSLLDALPLRGGRRPAWAVELDLEPGCNAREARRAFRKRALETHPDRPGGSHEAFLRSVQALDEALFAARG